MPIQKATLRKMPLLLGTTIALFASLGSNQDVKAQEIRSNIAPNAVRTVEDSNIEVNDLQPESLSQEAQTSLGNVADDLEVTVAELLSDPTIAEISASPSGKAVLDSLLANDGITVTPSGDFTVVNQISQPSVASVAAPQRVSVEATLDILD